MAKIVQGERNGKLSLLKFDNAESPPVLWKDSAKYVEGVSKLLFQCGSRDAKFCVSTTGLHKLLTFNVLCVAMCVETRRATSLQYQCRNFDTPSKKRACMFFVLPSRLSHGNYIFWKGTTFILQPSFSMVRSSLFVTMTRLLHFSSPAHSIRLSTSRFSVFGLLMS